MHNLNHDTNIIYYDYYDNHNDNVAMECSIYYINTNEIPNHFSLIVFWCERRDSSCGHSYGDIFTCEDNMLFSHVTIASFRAKAHLVFHWCLYNTNNYQTPPASAAKNDGVVNISSFILQVFPVYIGQL